MRVELQIDGIAELDRKLAALPRKVAQKVIRQAVRAAQKLALASIKARTRALPPGEPDGVDMSELMANAWELRVPKKQKPGSYALIVKLKALPQFFYKSKKGKTSWIPAAIEYGHGPGTRTTPRPFARPGADEAKAAVEARLAKELAAGIERAAQEGA